MTAQDDKDRSIKKSISFPQELWDFVMKKAGEDGVPSRVVQKAIRKMKEDEESESQGRPKPKK